MVIWELNFYKGIFISGIEGFEFGNLVVMFVEKVLFKNLDSFFILWVFFI